MTDKEYTYDIDKYTIGVDENGEDGIGLTIAIIKNGKINFLGNCYGENARCIDLLIKENAELKSQLRGTTHCFDEEEHNKLKEEITILSKEIDMWNSKYNDMFDENRELKKQLKDKVEDYKRMKDNFDSKVDALTKIATQQKKFIKYLEDEIKRINPNDLYIGELNLRLDDIKFTQYLIYKEILQKYKSIIGVSDENNKQ